MGYDASHPYYEAAIRIEVDFFDILSFFFGEKKPHGKYRAIFHGIAGIIRV